MTKIRLLYIILLVCPCFTAFLAYAAGPLVEFTPESLSDAIDMHSASIRLGNLAIEKAETGIAEAKDAYLPEVSAGWQAGYLGNGYLTDRDFGHGMSIANPHFVNNFAVEAQQCIYAGGAISSGVKLARLGKRMAELSLQADRQQVRFLILANLIDLDCLNKQKAVIVSNIELAEKMLVTMRARRDEGVALKSDITRYELQVADLRLQLDRLCVRISDLNHRIATALDYEADTQFALIAESVDDSFPMPGLDHWMQAGTAQNPRMQISRLDIDMSQTKLKLANAQRLPHIGAFAYARFDSPITIEVPVLNKNFMYWGFGVNITYNISSLYKSSKPIDKARTAVGQSHTSLVLTEQALSNDIYDAYNQWLTACSELRTQRTSLRLADDNYAIVSDRFDEGMALVTDLVDAANVRISAQTGLENAKSRLLFCLYKLKYLTNSL